MGGLLARAYGNAVVLRHAAGQHRLPFLSPDEVRERRDRRIRSLVRYAARTVPYYQRLFRQRRIDPRGVRGADDLKHLPLLEKGRVRADPDAFVSVSRRGRRSLALETSGTTGARLRIHHDRRSLLADVAFSERERQALVDVCGRFAGFRELALVYRSSTLRKISAFCRGRTYFPVRPRRRFVSVEEPLEKVVACINDYRPDLLVGYGSYLEALFRTVAARGLRLHAPRIVLYAAEAMSPAGREFIGREFGTLVFSRYNAVESLKIGFTCRAGPAFHLHADLCHVRLVDDNGNDTPGGRTGEVVISNLVNHGTVLINYRLGDLAVFSHEPCACGRSLPRLRELQGRVEDVLLLPDGRFVHPRAVWGVFKAIPEILRYQLVEHEPGRFELRLLTHGESDYLKCVDRVRRRMRELLGPVVLEPVYCRQLGVREPGKFRPVVARGTGD